MHCSHVSAIRPPWGYTVCSIKNVKNDPLIALTDVFQWVDVCKVRGVALCQSGHLTLQSSSALGTGRKFQQLFPSWLS